MHYSSLTDSSDIILLQMISSKKSHVMIMLTANSSSSLTSNLANMTDSDFWSFPHEFSSSSTNRHWAAPSQHLIKLGLLSLSILLSRVGGCGVIRGSGRQPSTMNCGPRLRLSCLLYQAILHYRWKFQTQVLKLWLNFFNAWTICQISGVQIFDSSCFTWFDYIHSVYRCVLCVFRKLPSDGYFWKQPSDRNF